MALRSLALLWVASGGIASGLHADGWEEAGRDDGVIIYVRMRAGASGAERHEVLGVGAIDAPAWVVKNAIDDFDATSGRMPYLKETRVIKRDADGVVVYNRTSAPIIADRDYTIRIRDASFAKA